MNPLELMQAAACSGLVWWCLCRARYMTESTRNTDRIAVVLIAIGASAKVLITLNAWWGWFSLNDGPLFEAMLYLGVLIWIAAPSVRKRLHSHELG